MKENKMSKIAENKYICKNQFDVDNSVVISNVWESENMKPINAHDGECKAVNAIDWLIDPENAGVDALICSKIAGLEIGDDVVSAVTNKNKYEFDYELCWLECTNEPNAKKAMSILKNLLKKYSCVLIRRKSRVAVVVELDRRVKYAIWKQVNNAFTMWLMSQMQIADKKLDKNRNKLVNAQFVHPVTMEADANENKIETVKAVNVKTDFARNSGGKYVIKTDNMMEYLKQITTKSALTKDFNKFMLGKIEEKKFRGNDGKEHTKRVKTWTKRSKHNAIIATDYMMPSLFKYNSLSRSVETMRTINMQAERVLIKKGQVTNNTVTNLSMWLEFGPEQPLTLNSKETLEVINAIAERNEYNPFLDYLNSLPKWDGKERIKHMFAKSLGAEDNELNSFLGYIVTVGLIYRVKNAGSKFDYVIDLVGDQGVGKSSLIQKLINNFGSKKNQKKADPNWHRANSGWYLDNFSGFKSKDELQSFIGKLYLNDDELVATRHTDPESIKAFATQTEFTFRKAYDIDHKTYQRSSILWRTTNDTQLYVSKMGQRKFYPIIVSKNNATWDVLGKHCVWTTDFVDQIWAEAVHTYVTKGQEWVTNLIASGNEGEIAKQRDLVHARLQYVDDVTMSVVGYIADKFAQVKDNDVMYISTRQILDDLDFNTDLTNRKLSRKISAIMRNDLGFDRAAVTYNGRRNLAGYTSTSKSRDAIALSCRAYHIDVDSPDAFVSSDADDLNKEIEDSLA
ncbi:virulence-associated E family protein [Limosilactobacillus reuteri]|uniref:virulence-associated E family protein n=1 Tax=Limosilactobacillus reuteri TaxID=1598 RepID=UPI001E52B5F7|nr:virulence-associated E family protein [Limosilactobacillus reuteri]MCC4503180.1 virulence-associated E family protein [Limosilactobacillus reuteri]